MYCHWFIGRSQKSLPSLDKTWVEQPTVDKSEPTGLILWLQFIGLAVVVAIAGYCIGEAGVSISIQTGLSESLVGSLLTALMTAILLGFFKRC